MQRLLEYIGHHPYLAGAAVIAVLAVLVSEIRERMSGLAALSSMQAVRLMNQGALVLDLRPQASFEAGHIADARNVPAAELAASADTLKKWREKTVITYCDSGPTGAAAARTLTKLGFTKVFSLDGGLAGWTKDNMPLARESSKGSNSKSASK